MKTYPVKYRMYIALLALKKAFESESEDGFGELEEAMYKHVYPALEAYRAERDSRKTERT